jgi:hypothetical protein
MKLNNPRSIRAEDFGEELQQPMGQLGTVINPFMQEVVELADGRIDFENTVFEIKVVEFRVNSNGVPILNNKISTRVPRPRGTQIINDFNLTNSTNYPTSAPYMSTVTAGNGILQVNRITGLVPNDTYRLTVIIY